MILGDRGHSGTNVRLEEHAHMFRSELVAVHNVVGVKHAILFDRSLRVNP